MAKHEGLTTHQMVVGFVAASVAPATSAIFTNPIEVVKVNLLHTLLLLSCFREK